MFTQNRIRTTFEHIIVDGQKQTIKIEERIDPLFPFYCTLISNVRAKRPSKLPERSATDAHTFPNNKELCFFEAANIHQTPEPREYHEELERDGYIPVSVPNKHGFATLGRVHCFTSHERHSLEYLERKDWHNYLAISAKSAQAAISNGYDSMFNIINLGRLAGGSQIHPHAQDGVLPTGRFSYPQQEIRYCFCLEEQLDDPFEHYFKELYGHGLACFENDDVFVAAAYAPRFPDQIDLFLKPKICSFAHLTEEQMPGVAEGFSYVTHFLSSERGIQDINICAHQDSLGAQSLFRLHFHFYPRNKNTLAGVEIGYGVYVVDTFPEETAAAFRKYVNQDDTIS